MISEFPDLSETYFGSIKRNQATEMTSETDPNQFFNITEETYQEWVESLQSTDMSQEELREKYFAEVVYPMLMKLYSAWSANTISDEMFNYYFEDCKFYLLTSSRKSADEILNDLVEKLASLSK